MTTKNDLILNHLKYAKIIARQRKKKLFSVSLEEIESAAFMGLVEAANVYDDQKSDDFMQFATFRIYGAIRDYLRELVWGTRKKPLINDKNIMEDLVAKSDKDHEIFYKIIEKLPENNKVALKKYYIDCDRMSDIACFLNVNESRISQIISESKKLLKNMWKHLEIELYESAA